MEKNFCDVLEELRGGETLNELTVALVDVVAAVQETGKPGTLNLSLKIQPEGAGRVVIHDDIKNKVPVLPKQSSRFFADEYGNLHRSDPKQGNLFQGGLKDVETAMPPKDMKEVQPEEKKSLRVVNS